MRRPHSLYASARGGDASRLSIQGLTIHSALQSTGERLWCYRIHSDEKIHLKCQAGAQICIHALIVLLLASQMPCTGRFVGY